MENSNSQSMPSPSSLLLCEENLGSLGTQDEEIFVDGYDDEYIKVLLDREISKGTPDLLQKNWIQGARVEGINYIFRKRELLEFGFRTAYTSVSYLDRFLPIIRDVEKPWAIRLSAMGCLSLAAKMEEKMVPPLPEFCEDDFLFESSAIQRMELLILNTLEWKMGAVTPFDFIHFFADKLFDEKTVRANAFSRTVEIILGAIREAKIMCYSPSVIAASATLVVLDQGLKREALELKIIPLNSSHSFNIESIISCYGLLQEMQIERLKLSKDTKSPDLSPIQLLPYGSSSVPSAKRKRLVFNQEDELGDEKQLPSKQRANEIANS